MNETKEKTVPARKTSPGPAGLDGIQISGCAFTESVGKKEPRPPLVISPISRNIALLVGPAHGRYVYVARQNETPDYGFFVPPVLGALTPIGDLEEKYTGPISKSMWIEIRKWWQP